MPIFEANIYNGERTLLEGLSVHIEEITESSGIKAWSGGFDLSGSQHIDPGPYRISLDDGRAGRILVTDVNVSSHSPTRVFFDSAGPLA